jgi:hypothetical protein
VFRRTVKHPITPLAIGAAILGAAHLHGYLEIALPVLPLLLLVLSLLFGIYPGCETIVRLAERLGVRPRPRAAENERAPAPSPSRSLSGGLLIAFGLAQRPPPFAA